MGGAPIATRMRSSSWWSTGASSRLISLPWGGSILIQIARKNMSETPPTMTRSFKSPALTPEAIIAQTMAVRPRRTMANPDK